MNKINGIQIFTSSGCLSAEAMMHAATGDLTVSDAASLQKHLETCAFCREAMEGMSKMSNPQHLTHHLKDIRKQVDANRYFRWQNQPTLQYAVAATLAIVFVASSVVLWYPKTQENLALRYAPENSSVPTLELPVENKIAVESSGNNLQPANSIATDSLIHPPQELADVAVRNEDREHAKQAVEENEVHQASSSKKKEKSEVAEGAAGGSGAALEAFSFSSASSLNDKSRARSVSNSGSYGSSYRVTTNYDYLYRDAFSVVEEPPKFKGGASGLKKYISRHVNYPEVAMDNGIEGKVYIQFMIDREGKVSNTTVVQGVDSLLDKEALRVIQNLPRWEPGKMGGIPVNVYYIIPVEFRIGANN